MLTTTQEGKLEYDDPSHTYWLNGRKLFGVTSTIKKYFKPFEREVVADAVYDSVNSYAESANEVEAGWSRANQGGKELHNTIDEYLRGKELVNPHHDFHRFLKFWQATKLEGYTCYSEYAVCDAEANIAGTIDCLLVDNEANFVILDWKRCKAIRARSWRAQPHDPPTMGKYPFQAFEDCNFTHYSLQLNFYRTMLERHYRFNDKPLKCKAMFLIVFSPGLPNWSEINVPNLDLSGVWLNLAY